MRWPRLILSPSSTLRRAPYWMRCTARSAPSAPTMTTATLRRHDDQFAVGVPRHVAVADPHRALEVGLDEGLIGDLRRAADVEGAHRELRARLADRLRRDDADRLAHVDRRAAGEIAAVAGAADAVLRLAGEDRTDLHLLDAGGGDPLDVPLLDHRRLAARSPSPSMVGQVLRRGAAEDARGERGDDLAGIDDRAHADAVARCRNRARG